MMATLLSCSSFPYSTDFYFHVKYEHHMMMVISTTIITMIMSIIDIIFNRGGWHITQYVETLPVVGDPPTRFKFITGLPGEMFLTPDKTNAPDEADLNTVSCGLWQRSGGDWNDLKRRHSHFQSCHSHFLFLSLKWTSVALIHKFIITTAEQRSSHSKHLWQGLRCCTIPSLICQQNSYASQDAVKVLQDSPFYP